MAAQILIFGGTTEGRQAAERLLAEGVPCTVCVATDYGAEVMEPHPLLTVHTGRMDRCAMAQLMQGDDAPACRESRFSCVIDATHPHAAAASEEIRAACRQTGLAYLRLQRDTSADGAGIPQTQMETECVFVSDVEEAGKYLSARTGRILVTTGSKELVRFAKALGDADRITARVLPSQESLRACAEAGLAGKQIFAMQGPFDTEMNCALIRHAKASWLLTKETGAAGGYPEKIEAVQHCGICAVVIRTPSSGNGNILSGNGNTALITGNDSSGTGSAFLKTGNILSGNGNSFLKTGNTSSGSGNTSSETAQELLMTSLEQVLEAARKFNRQLDEEKKSRQDRAQASEEPRRLCGVQTAEEPEQGAYREMLLVGIGVGARSARTQEAQEALDGAQVLFGARSVLQNLLEDGTAAGKETVSIYESAAILQYLQEHPQVRSAAVAYSGDSGFYSGASSMLAKIQRRDGNFASCREASRGGTSASCGEASRIGTPASCGADGQGGNFVSCGAASRSIAPASHGAAARGSTFDFSADVPEGLHVRIVCGISCVSWFAARAGIPWQDWKILSSHGRFCNVVGQVRRHAKCFLLLSGAEDVRRTGEALAQAQAQGMLGGLRLIYGYELSRPAEEIRGCTVQELSEISKEGLYVLYMEHEAAAETPVLPGLPDSAFLRGKAPMTSAEIRALSLCRLGLTSQAVVWDVGAGTGSVSVEAALACPEGRVWSVEFKKDALELLAQNRAKFCLLNMEIIEGRAPQALADLPAPTHVFVGGSGGEIGEVLKLALTRSPGAKFVVNCITAETMMALQAALESLPVRDVQCTQVSVQRGDTLGRYHYLRALNPVFIISFAGAGGTGGQAPCPTAVVK